MAFFLPSYLLNLFQTKLLHLLFLILGKLPDLCMSAFSSFTHFSFSRSSLERTSLPTLAPVYIMVSQNNGEEESGGKAKEGNDKRTGKAHSELVLRC